MTAGWEHFSDWKRINSEGEKGVISLETLIRGTCEKTRFLDLVENFTVFDDAKGGLIKMVAKNHQYLGVNNAIAALQKIKANQGKLGVFWHTQGSGKSFSMVFFCPEGAAEGAGQLDVRGRHRPGRPRRPDLQELSQHAGRSPKRCQAESGEHLKQLLHGGPPLHLHADPEVRDRRRASSTRSCPTAPTSS